MDLDLALKISITIGNSITLGVGMWHFIVPSIFKWMKYIPDAPEYVKNVIKITNFFFSLVLTMLGIISIYTTFWQWENIALVRFILVLMSILWLTRVIYQVIRPQGELFYHLAHIFLGLFTLTLLLFLVPTIIIFI